MKKSTRWHTENFTPVTQFELSISVYSPAFFHAASKILLLQSLSGLFSFSLVTKSPNQNNDKGRESLMVVDDLQSHQRHTHCIKAPLNHCFKILILDFSWVVYLKKFCKNQFLFHVYGLLPLPSDLPFCYLITLQERGLMILHFLIYMLMSLAVFPIF